MDWGTDLWDQCDIIDKHTLSGLDLVDRYIKFVKERTEIEQGYAKQLRSLSKKYAKRGSKEEQDCKFSNHASFQEILNELNDYAGQRELIAENMMTGICVELTKYLQDIKSERKTHLADAKKAQQNLEGSFKHLESTKKRFAKEWVEADKATQQADKTENDLNATKLDVEKAKQHAHARTHTAEECRNDYAAELQKYNKEQNNFYYTDIPQIFNKMQDMDERRIRRLAEGYCQFSDIEKKVLPIISKCLEGISSAGVKIQEKQDSLLFIEQHKSGFERPGDVEFEDYTQGIKPATSDSSLNPPKVRTKLWPFSKKHKFAPPSFSPPSPLPPGSHPLSLPLSKLQRSPLSLCVREFNRSVKPRISTLKIFRRPRLPTATEDFSHLPPEQRKKRLQAKIDEIAKELQKAQDQSEALDKMKGVYEQNPQMGDPSSLEPQITETAQNLGRLKGEIAKYESWLSEAVGGEESSNTINNNIQHGVVAADQTHNIYTEFDDEFDDIEAPIGQCAALYTFEGNSEGTISITEGEMLNVMEEDKGDGWMRVLRASGEEGYIPSSYVKVNP
ncbi:cdc42-interacting protein 4 homolog isoform X1 [Hippoglossus hippoglossus]|uniref:cdc42-interacting protein 4 homolog isoform X1 n=1 Tax=Hippoglossus hippoglossus TaxID=8267 RepID=UPI00148E853B|nr:cdc42-interacting protein 4 homolog isoform X1 [Hippoglossus hippoglossus]